MVSTPIAPAAQNQAANVPPPPPPFLQPTLQPGMPYLYSKSPPHTFPVLYNGPVSLYSEYVGNPYNNVTEGPKEVDENSTNLDVNKNNDLVEGDSPNNNTNVFQSSNYFSSDAGTDLIPPGSEILFGTEQGNFTIPTSTNSDIKTSDV
jgi:hypothetical protein